MLSQNYSKHGEEWPAAWDKLSEIQRYTADTISACGSTGNLRAGAKVLGNRTFSDTLKFATIVSTRAKSLESSYQAEVTRRVLLKATPPTS